MKKLLVLSLALTLVAIACGDDDTSNTSIGAEPSDQLTATQREWCTLSDASEGTALRFDQIFEAGLELSLPMDELNAQASGLRTEYEADGMSATEAIVKVSEQLLREPTFLEACQAAHIKLFGGGEG